MLRVSAAAFDRVEAIWVSARTRRAVASVLALGYLGALLAIEASQRGWLPPPLRFRAAHGHYLAVELAIYLLLAYEIVGLVLGIAQSVSNAAGKQFEIFSLILLRHSFEEFGHLGEPIVWEQAREPVVRMLSNGFGALVIFVIIGFYYAAQRHRPITEDAGDRQSFIAAKKLVSLVLLGVFGWLAVRAAALGQGGFFEAFYTVLVLADVLLVFLSLRYSVAYHVVFRNSGLALATVMLRVALSAPPFYDAALGIASSVFALALTLACNRVDPALGRRGRARAATPDSGAVIPAGPVGPPAPLPVADAPHPVAAGGERG
jgi:hypothetical protein